MEIAHADVKRLEFLDALVNAALARQLQELSFLLCPPPSGAPLARLLRGGTLTTLEFSASEVALFETAAAALVADALRATTALTALKLLRARLCEDMHAAGVLLGALVGHPSLRSLSLVYEDAADRTALGALLAPLIVADAPALQKLSFFGSKLGDKGLAPLMDVLSRNTHLRSLDLRNTDYSEAFARERLLPAVRANKSLRELMCTVSTWAPVVEAMEFVRSRTRRS